MSLAAGALGRHTSRFLLRGYIHCTDKTDSGSFCGLDVNDSDLVDS